MKQWIRLAVCMTAAWFPFSQSTAAPLMYVPSGGGNEIVVIDVADDRIVQRIGELENAHGLAAAPGGEYLVAGSMQAVQLDQKNAVEKPAQVSDAEHKKHHVADAAPIATPSFLSVVHIKHGHVTRRISVAALTHHTAVSPNGQVAIAVHSAAGMISIVNMETMAVTQTLKTGAAPNYAVFSRDGARLYVSNGGGSSVSEIDTASWSVLREFPAGKKPEHLSLSSDGNALYVAAVDGAAVSVLDLATGKTTKTYATGKGPHGVALSANGSWLFAAGLEDGSLVRWDLSTGTSQRIDLKPAPYHVEYVDAVKKLYVSSRIEPKIWVIDPETLKVLSVIELGKGAVGHQMVVM